MLKYIAPLSQRLRHIQRPHVFRAHDDTSDLSIGQRLAERAASAIGSWPFLIVQNVFIGLWMIANVFAWVFHWDPYPFILLNLMLSTQAAETGPILLIAANVGALRDHAQADRIERLEATVLAELRSLRAEVAELRETRARDAQGRFTKKAIA